MMTGVVLMDSGLFQNKYRIESARLKEWDYSWDGYYFVTICVKGNQQCLGGIVKGVMKLSESGKIVKRCWENLPLHYWNCRLDEYIIMSNHVHGIIVIDNRNPDFVETGFKPVSTRMAERYSLSEMIRGFKTFSAKEINQLHGVQGQPFWQSRFHDHIIRNDQDLERLREYICTNPLKWELGQNKKQVSQ